MATPNENKPATITTESATAKPDICFTNTGLSSQHVLFANLVKNRGGYIPHQEEIISKPSCNRCASHIRSSLTDLRALSASRISVRHRNDDDDYGHRHRHHSSCPKYRNQTLSRQHTVTEPKQYDISSRSPRVSRRFSAKQSMTREQQIATKFPSSITNKQDKPKSRIPVSTSVATSSPSLPHSGNQVVLENNTSMIPRHRSLLNKQGKEHNQAMTNRQSDYIIIPSGPFNTIMVLFRPTNIGYEVRIYQDMPVKDVITDVCRQANMYTQNDCYLWFDSRELDINDTIFQAGLYEAENLRKNLPEVRLKYVQMLQASSHISKHVFLTSPEKVAHNEILNIPLPSVKKHIIPNVLKEVAEQIAKHASLANQSSHQFDTVLIPLPNFSKQLIDSLPTIDIRVPLSPDQFDWNEFLECLAIDLEIDRTDLIIVTVRQGSSIFKIKLRPIITQIGEKVKKFTDKLLVLILPKCEKFIAERMPSNISEVKKIEIELKNFTERKITEDIGSVSPDEIDLALRLSERPAIINDISWSFLIEKSRQITTSIIQSIQSCSDEHTIDHASLIYNEKIYDKYERLNIDKSEKVLFHGTNTINFDGIFQNNFQCNSGAKATDKGWYGQGIYFSSSPEKALNYAKSGPTVSYLICSLVRLGKTLTVTDLRYKGKPMHQDYDSHYVPIRKDGDPVSQGEIPAFEEFVIKKNDQIIPLYIVGMLKVFCFVIWRDAKITNEANSSLFEQLKNRYAFNIYGIQTSTEALDILKLKLKNDSMKCVVVTNGADDGEGFVRQCRAVRPSLPIIVYCKNTTYHQQWAATLPTPKINVTSSPEYVFDYITNTLQK